ncbi:hypothetical protein F5880DRAFT_897777 [Lentinula raphanica]|nr:hypothetical protein F5880DRAFT_897777 [Lentinula raphanica]
MSLHLPLPNELLHFIIDHIAFGIPKLPDSLGAWQSKTLFQWASPELLALSVASWQLRQACMPFVYANIRIRCPEDVEMLEKHAELCSKYTKALAIDIEAGRGLDQNISKIVPQLAQLFYVELQDCQNRTDMLKTLLAHPTVTSIQIHELPPEFTCFRDLSKVVIEDQLTAWGNNPEIHEYFNRGMRVLCIDLHRSWGYSYEQRLSQIVSWSISGLREIRMYMYIDPVSFSFLTTLPLTYPTLNVFWVLDAYHHNFNRQDPPPFLSSFFDNARRRGFSGSFELQDIGLRRPVGQSSREWFVMGLRIRITRATIPLIEMLTLMVTSFPNLEVLQFQDLVLISQETTYHIDELTAVFKQFSFLKTLYLDGVYNLLDFGNIKLPPPIRQVDSADALDIKLARAETGLLWFTSRVAKEIKCLNALYISEKPDPYQQLSMYYWQLTGWLHVINGNRGIGGMLQQTLVHGSRKLHSEISLETRMLPPDLKRWRSPTQDDDVSIAGPELALL